VSETGAKRRMDRFDPSIEPKWREFWAREGIFKAGRRAGAPRRYILEMFPYPSGDLHIGHLKNYVIGDALTRYYVIRGYDVLHPFGWDAFGLPAENAAIKYGRHPREWTYSNIAESKKSLEIAGIMYDWSREVTTCNPDYYRWNQWLFLLLYRKGLAYRAKATVNWDPVDQTVLANEQVDAEGRSWRSGAKVEKRELEQWFFRITAYAERLLNDLDKLDHWPENVKTMQRNWIGRSEGAEVTFLALPPGADLHAPPPPDAEPLVVFTTRPDTLWGATFMVLAPEHPLAPKLTAPERRTEVEAYIARARMESEIERTSATREKSGVFLGSYAINPVNDERIPIWIADYVLMGYGTGAIMAVPAHDQRDFEFARQFGLPVRVVVQPPGETLDGDTMTEAWPGDGVMVNSGPINGIPVGKGEGQSVKAAIAWLEAQGKGKGTVTYRLRDWLISRQRYWAPLFRCCTCRTERSSRRRRINCRYCCPKCRITCRKAKARWQPPSTGSIPSIRKPVNRRGAIPIQWIPSSTHRGISCASATRRMTARSFRAKRRASGCRSISISAALNTRSCTCSTPASSPRCCTTKDWCQKMSRSRRSSRRGWCNAAFAHRSTSLHPAWYASRRSCGANWSCPLRRKPSIRARALLKERGYTLEEESDGGLTAVSGPVTMSKSAATAFRSVRLCVSTAPMWHES
jgi:leucyl-tRNA synthetase